ncbi:hypothetical protein D3C86_1055820 [compost metagenome]
MFALMQLIFCQQNQYKTTEKVVFFCMRLLGNLSDGLRLSASLHIMKVQPFGEIVKGGRDARDRI